MTQYYHPARKYQMSVTASKSVTLVQVGFLLLLSPSNKVSATAATASFRRRVIGSLPGARTAAIFPARFLSPLRGRRPASADLDVMYFVSEWLPFPTSFVLRNTYGRRGKEPAQLKPAYIGDRIACVGIQTFGLALVDPFLHGVP